MGAPCHAPRGGIPFATDMEAILSFATRADFRAWLAAHHLQEESVWLEFFKDGRSALTRGQALEEALCYGWIDSQVRRADEVRYRQKFSKRRKRSRWSARNRELAMQLIASGRMTPAGQAEIDRAKSNGAWEAADPRPAFEDTAGFLRLIGDDPGAVRRYEALTDSLRRQYAGFYFSAKLPATREKRMKLILEAMETGKRIMG